MRRMTAARYRTVTITAGGWDRADREDLTSTDERDPSEAATLPPDVPQPHPLTTWYVLLDQIGSGATGRVWRATRRADGATVAVKVLREEYATDPDTQLRFLRESAALRAVHHPHLVAVHDFVAGGDTMAIVMDFVDGQNLRYLLADGAMDRERAVLLLGQLAEALAVVHRAGVVHRDVKPENVLVTRRGGHPWAQLTDFGLARITEGPAVTRVGQLLGTPAYLAPEVATGREAVPASDVYALGLTGYEMLAGRRPFTAANPVALLRAHVEAEPLRPDGLAEPLWEVIRDCLAKDPQQRPNAEKLAVRLAALRGRSGALPVGAPAPVPPKPVLVTAAPPVAAPASATNEQPEELATAAATRPVPPAPEPAPPNRRRRWPWIAALVALALLGAAGGVWTGRARTPARPAPAPPSRASTSTSTYQLYYLPVIASSPKAGTVRLDFADSSNLPGFYFYLIYRDVTVVGQVDAGHAPPYLLQDVDRQTNHCYRVAALVPTGQPTPPAPKPACLTA